MKKIIWNNEWKLNPPTFSFDEKGYFGKEPDNPLENVELIEKNNKLKIALLDRGEKVSKRFCPMNKNKTDCKNCNPCRILSGYGGAGTFSDGKLNFIPKLGKSDLTKYMSLSEANKLIDDTEEIFNKFNMDAEVYPSNMDEALKIKKEVAKMNSLIGDEDRLRQIAKDFINLYEIRKGEFEGNEYVIMKMDRDNFIIFPEYDDGEEGIQIPFSLFHEYSSPPYKNFSHSNP